MSEAPEELQLDTSDAPTPTLEQQIEPILAEPMVVKIPDASDEYPRAYKMQRLGWAEQFDLIKILRAFEQAEGRISLASLYDIYQQANESGEEIVPSKIIQQAEGMIYQLLYNIEGAREPIMRLCARVLGVTVEELQNPDRFPMSSVLGVVTALFEHPDTKSFFLDLKTLMGWGSPENPPALN